MKIIEPIEFPGFDEVVNNAQFYFDKFLEDKVIAFRNANLTLDEQELLQKKLGDVFGWYPNTKSSDIRRYFEDHKNNKRVNKVGADEIMLNWHVEHVGFSNPIVAALWNMLTFTTDSENGKTYFVDVSEVYNSLPEESKTFLQNSTINARYDQKDLMLNTPAIQKHWAKDMDVIRLPIVNMLKGGNDLYRYGNGFPSQTEKQKYLEIAAFIKKEVETNEDIRLVHKWKQGDLVIPDLFRLAHAVTGGFSPEERKFSGLWCHKKDLDIYKEYNA